MPFHSSSTQREKCLRCGKTVYQMERIGFEEKIFHQSCFKCSTCNISLKLSNFVSSGLNLYCESHGKVSNLQRVKVERSNAPSPSNTLPPSGTSEEVNKGSQFRTTVKVTSSRNLKQKSLNDVEPTESKILKRDISIETATIQKEQEISALDDEKLIDTQTNHSHHLQVQQLHSFIKTLQEEKSQIENEKFLLQQQLNQEKEEKLKIQKELNQILQKKEELDKEFTNYKRKIQGKMVLLKSKLKEKNRLSSSFNLKDSLASLNSSAEIKETESTQSTEIVRAVTTLSKEMEFSVKKKTRSFTEGSFPRVKRPIRESSMDTPVASKISSENEENFKKKIQLAEIQLDQISKREEDSSEITSGKKKNKKFLKKIFNKKDRSEGNMDSSKEINIGIPTNVQHEGHFGFDKGGLLQTRNLPPQYQNLFDNLNKTLQSMGVERMTEKETRMVLKLLPLLPNKKHKILSKTKNRPTNRNTSLTFFTTSSVVEDNQIVNNENIDAYQPQEQVVFQQTQDQKALNYPQTYDYNEEWNCDEHSNQEVPYSEETVLEATEQTNFFLESIKKKTSQLRHISPEQKSNLSRSDSQESGGEIVSLLVKALISRRTAIREDEEEEEEDLEQFL